MSSPSGAGASGATEEDWGVKTHGVTRASKLRVGHKIKDLGRWVEVLEVRLDVDNVIYAVTEVGVMRYDCAEIIRVQDTHMEYENE